MAAKRNNHIVTRGYLAGWNCIENGQNGIWYFDTVTRKVHKAQSLNAPFAKVKDIYVPKVAGKRDDRLENWFASFESELCDFVRDFRANSQRKWKPVAVKKALSGIVSLGYRSEHSIRWLEKELSQMAPDADKDEIALAVLNNLYDVIREQIEFFCKGQILLLEWDTPVLMTNDCPFWDLTPTAKYPIALFALSPTKLMVFLPNEQVAGTEIVIRHKDGRKHPGILQFARDAAMRMARSWVVCSDMMETNYVENYLSEQMIAQVQSTDRPISREVQTKPPMFEGGASILRPKVPL